MKVTINMPKAKEIHRNNIRVAREPKLQELDVQFQRALEKPAGSNTLDIVNRKQVLRDLPSDPKIEQAKTPEELKELWPCDLLGTSPYN
jgi:hypothetical protein